MTTETPPSRLQQGEITRSRILKAAMDLASRQGLEALSIGELAKELDLSKSGLFAHFGSKEELQIATIEAAERVFTRLIIQPAQAFPAGLQRLRALLEAYLDYLEAKTFPGGCFFTAAAAEYDDRPGRVRDRIVISMRIWRGLLEEQAIHAQATGEMRPEIDPIQLVFEVKAFAHEANFNRQLLDDANVHGRAKQAIRSRLREAGKSS